MLSKAFLTEHRAIFGHDWVCVGRIEDLSGADAYLRIPLTPASILITRGDDGELRAFHAICTHRGAGLFFPNAPEEGEARQFRCPYHGMVFGNDGAPCASGGSPLAKTTPPLSPARVEVAHGFVFVNLDPQAASLEEALGETPPWLERAELSNLKRARRMAFDVKANWKLVVDNFQESLHFESVHPALEVLTPSAQAETWMPESGGPWLGGIMPIREGAETVSMSARFQGRPLLVPPEDLRVVHDAMRFPNLLTSLQPEYLLTFTLFPIDGETTRVVASTYVHAEAPEESLADVLDFWSRIYDEDKRACEQQQVGLSSPGAPATTLTEVEEGVLAFRAMVEARRAPSTPLPSPKSAGSRHCGIFGRPYADLSSLVDTSGFAAMHDEITRGLSLVETSYTGGSLKWMGVTAPWVTSDPYRDYMHVIRALPRDELAELIALGDGDPSAFDLDRPESIALGDETDHPLTRAQMLFLKMRHGVYFPWKVCYHLLENDRWEDKHSGEGKDFSEEARRVFPKTVAFLESLPFTEIGRVVIFGIEANDHAPAHRDSEPGKALALAQSISFEPSRLAPRSAGRHKRFYVTSPDGANQVVVDAPIYWFNDMDWHGVLADPFFRYSIRVDGVFDPRFLADVRRETRSRR
ncbi:Phenylpropionate dioxygenase [Labilithrix luteola]|uniref:Phenylpropionate dioxygenase n=1 Tax=Labilithrix luteola TaxID=1391654 RepID=A0A0K1Q5X1_9BACT|nr:aromatic ring-hydroxylating dioxygenase subunit alpha [Labilithrix luteola]AKV01138.1 Phenylpropionate dioxygenase [Labilithrix luteola]